ncbi:TPA: polysaccharide biosynthesis C-terminal domain-containing protein [Enterococcus faecalis]
MKKIMINFVYQSANQLLLIFIPIITIPIVSSALGPEGLGEWNYINSIVNYFVLLAGLGLSTYGVKEIATVSTNKKMLSQKFWEIQKLNFIVAGFTFILYLFFSLLNSPSLLFLTQSLMVFSVALDISWFFGGIEKFKKIFIRNVFLKGLTFISIIAFVKDRDDLWKYFIINSLSIFLSQSMLWISLSKYIEYKKVKWKDSMVHFKPAVLLFFEKAGTVIFTNMNKTLLGLIGTIVEVGLYSNSLTMVLMLSGVVGALNIVMLPKMSNLKDQNEKRMVKTLEDTLHIQMFITIAIMFGILATNEKLIPWFFGEKFSQMLYIVPIFAPIVVIQTLHKGIATQYLVPKSEIKAYNYSLLAGIIFSIILDIVLIPYIGVYGAAVSFLFAHICVLIIRVRALLKHTSFKFHKKEIVGYVSIGFLMYSIVTIFTKDMDSNLFTSFFQATIGMTVYWFGTWISKVNPICKNKINL